MHRFVSPAERAQHAAVKPPAPSTDVPDIAYRTSGVAWICNHLLMIHIPYPSAYDKECRAESPLSLRSEKELVITTPTTINQLVVGPGIYP